MPDVRSITAVFSADVRGLVTGVNQAKGAIAGLGSSTAAAAGKGTTGLTAMGAASTRLGGTVSGMSGKIRSEMTAMTASIRDNEQAWGTISTTALAAGAGITAGLGLATKAAISWESAWTGVTKTVDGSAEQMAQLESELRGLTKVLPATHEEIAGVAEAAGQLGVKRQDIAGFTKTMIDLGEATNLTADEAATSIAQISNVMGTMAREGATGVQRFGSALVALGNAGASTERDILAVTSRLSGAAVVIGATEADTLALGSAMASLGIQAELGGGVMSRTMLTINSAVLAGGDGLREFARVAGVSAQEFAEKWRTSPVEAIAMFTSGLGRISEQGGDAAGTLDELGLAGTQNASVLLRMAGASDTVNESLATGRQAWADNTALVEEASKRYETTESRMRIAMNSIRDAMIDAGSVIAPVVAKLAEGAAALADAFVKLPGPVQSALTGLAGFAAAALLVGGGFVKAVASVTALKDALTQVSAVGPKSAQAVNAVGKAVSALAAAAVAGNLINAAFGSNSGGLGSEALTQRLLGNANAVDAFNAAISDYQAKTSEGWWNVNGIRNFADALQAAFDPHLTWQIDNVAGAIGGLVGIENQSMIQRSAQVFQMLDTSLSGLVTSGHADRASQMFDQLAAAAEKQGVSVDQLRSRLPQYGEALAGAANQATLGAAGVDTFGRAVDASGAAAAESAEQIKSMAETVLGLFDAAIAAANADVALAQAIADTKTAADGATVAVNANRTAFDLNTAAGRANQTQLASLAAAALDAAEKNLRNGASVDQVSASLTSAQAVFVAAAQRMGLSKDAAVAMAQQMGIAGDTAVVLKNKIGDIPAAKNTKITLDASQATAAANGIIRTINSITGKTVVVNVVYKQAGSLGASTAGGQVMADGGIIIPVRAFASGGYDGTIGAAQPRIRAYQGPRGILWSEKGSGPWEAFISGHPSKADRSRRIWLDVGKRLGMIAAHADGAIRQARTYQPAAAIARSRAVTPNITTPDIQVTARVAPSDVAAIGAAVEAGAARGMTGVARAVGGY